MRQQISEVSHNKQKPPGYYVSMFNFDQGIYAEVL